MFQDDESGGSPSLSRTIISDPALVPDAFATGITAPEIRDGFVRYTAFVERQSVPGGPIECIVVARIVVPIEAAMAVIEASIRAFAALRHAH